MNYPLQFPRSSCSSALFLAAALIAAGAALGRELAAPPVIPIGLVQGQPDSGSPAETFPSPQEGNVVTVQGVVHELYMRYSRRDSVDYGFYLQNTRETADADPATSDGIFVYSQRKRQLDLADAGTYVPRVGDEIVLTGKIREIMNETQLTASHVQRVLRNHVDLEQELQIETVAFAPNMDATSASSYWERHEGMRMRLPGGCIVQGAGHTFGEADDAEFRVILPDSIPAQRANPYERRVFRDAHPLDDLPDTRFDNDNPYRIVLSSLGLKGSTHNAKALLPPVRTFETLVEPLLGAVRQRYEHYSLQPDTEPVLQPGINPAGNGRLPPLPLDEHFTVVTFNLENLYDTRNDPDDACDDHSDEGNAHVSKPFDYLPRDDQAYQRKLNDLANQITRGMQSPDLLLLQEVEDQDILVTNADRLVPATSTGDGELDVLQELCRAIRALGGPAYRSATDRNGADYRGITTAFLYRTDRVRLVEIDAEHPIFGDNLNLPYRGAASTINRDVSNPKAINAALPADVDLGDGMSGSNVFSRPPQVALFDVIANADASIRLYVIDNHFSSRPDQRVGQRIEQATVNAVLAREIEKSDPDARIILGGDLNVFPRPDDPLPEQLSDQLASLYDAGLHNLYEELIQNRPDNAYSYVYQGQAGMLDHLFVNAAMHKHLAQVWVPHFNSDWSPDPQGDLPFGASDHDPILATFRFSEEPLTPP